MRVNSTPTFSRNLKKLHPNQKKSLDRAVQVIMANPEKGEAKVGDLAGIYIYKFKVNKIQWLLAYRLVTKNHMTLLVVGPHENFYRDLKNDRNP
jgi:mRNA-degrading endonuclease RelE of RelBE toxin-antitoxin system